MTLHDIVEEKVLEGIKPKPEEYRLIHEKYSLIKELIENYMRDHGYIVEASLQGSIAHDTWLSGDRDVDVFVLFDKSISVNELKDKCFKLLLDSIRERFKYELRYAEHPYIRLYVDEVVFDIVPAYKLESPSEIKTAVDRTPFHTMYLNSKLTPWLRDQVRLLKRFMKNIGVYGAEVKTRGFSGYVAELLVVVFNGFRNVLREASKWKIPVFINTLEYSDADFKNLCRRLRRKYPDSVIYIPDPVDPERNAGANISIEKLAKFIIASQCYINNPSEKFFFKENIVLKEDTLCELLKNRCMVLLRVDIGERLSPDVLWGELWRIADRACKVLENNEFKVLDYSVWSDEVSRAFIIYELEECYKSSLRLYKGPPVWVGERVLDYIRKHSLRKSIGPWINKYGELVSLSNRKYTDAVSLLHERSWEYMVAPHFKNTKPIVSIIDCNMLSEIVKTQGVSEWIAEFILKKPFWMEYCIE